MSAVGTDVPRVDGNAKVAGSAQYTADIELPGMLHAKALRSPHPHAKLVSVDVSRAAALPGVIAVVTRDDLDGLNPYYGAVVEDQPVLAIDRVRCVGDIVAAVAAEEREIAEEAVELIEVEYEPLPAVFDVVAAAGPAAPIIHEERFETQAAVFREQLNLNAGGNVCSVFRAGDGDVDAGFAEADEIFENTYSMPPVQHGHIEPHVATALWESPNRLVVHTPCQNAVGLQEQLARIFDLPESGVRVVVPFVGGGYGGKTHARLEPVTALLARKAGRPVQWVLTREEVFLTGRRYGGFVRMKTGFKHDGSLVAREVEVFYDLGAYALSGPANAKTGSYVASGPYRVPNRRLTTYAVYTNLPPAGPYRGVGVPHTAWAYESEMDRIARHLGMDPLELRLKNLLQEGDIFVTGESLVSVGVSDCLRQAAAGIGWRGREEQADEAGQGTLRRGKGLAVIMKSTTTPTASAASVRLNGDGSVMLLTSSTEIGQGVRTCLAQIVADRLGFPVERVTVSAPDTDVTPYDKSTSSSRTTFHMGNAALRAAEDVREQLLEAGAEALEVDKADLELGAGGVSVRGVPDRSLTIPQLLRVKYGDSVGSIFGNCNFQVKGGLDPKTGKGKAAAFWFFSACAAEVEVDVETGKVRVLDIATSVDVGKAINPLQCWLQNEGSMLEALGAAFFEEMVFEQGQPVNGTLLEYMLPSMEDHPERFQSLLVENPHPDGPFGAKGAGEAVIPAVVPAIGNAVANALGGVNITELPLRPERIVAALAEREASASGEEG
ncbi:MAG: xanthine dehydrogenase family protein molybdopterin-binding subunit [Deltaproteobacteria bacterium]|nr:xanthine dehydrogenase family protein molybdopterin-binding subunit [Deltaproteobacteria bacterium]